MTYTMRIIYSDFIDIGPRPEPYIEKYKSIQVFLELIHQIHTVIKVDPKTPKGLFAYTFHDEADKTKIYYEAVGIVIQPITKLRKFSGHFPLIACPFPIFIPDYENTYDPYPVDTTNIKLFKFFDTIKVTGYLEGKFDDLSIITESEQEEKFQNKDIPGYSIVANIQNQIDNESYYMFTFNITQYKLEENGTVFE